MGGKISLFGRKNSENDDEENLRRYQEKLDADGTFGFSDSLDKKNVTWWEYLLYEKRVRIAYVFILGVLLGIVIPVIIFATKLENKEKPIYGSCLIKENARFECLINSKSPVTEKECVSALCCWQNKDDIAFKCYHSFPSAYQYNVTSISETTVLASGNKDEVRQGSPYTIWTQLDMKAAHSDKMSPLRVLTHWESTEHLVMEIFNSDVFPDRKLPSSSKSKNKASKFIDDADLPFSVSWGEDQRFFYVSVSRRDTDETIFDTRLGPVYASGKDITLATILPTEFFYGLKGGQGSTRTQTYGIVNGFENSEFPFYISFERSGKWHGVLFDTSDPILVQVVQAPGLMLHLETDKPEINVHFFAGPSQKEILSELHSYIRQKHNINHPPMIPSYWGLGLHLCRKLENGTMVLQDIQALLPEDKAPAIVYDSDCIDEYLRHPIYVNETQFPSENLTEILTLLQTNKKRIVLSQKSTILVPPVEDKEDEQEGEMVTFAEEDLEQEYFRNALILHRNKSNQLEPFQGQLGDKVVKYLDFFNIDFPEDFPPLPKQTNASDAELIPYNGFSMDDNFPKLDLSKELCQSPGTRLQSFFTTSLLTTSSGYINVSSLWGSVCPDSLHGSTGSKHIALHNVYGEQALKKVHSSRGSSSGSEILLTSSSYWTGSMYYGGYNGMQVPFTWNGLKEAVLNTVRNYAIAPVSATPICGGMLSNVNIAKNNVLCLRWFQFGLLLPLARNSYDGKSSYGPLDLPGQYRVYLNETIKARYTLAPYYYTTLHAYQSTYVPMVRPMSFDFSRPHERNETLPLVDQFMVGDAILAAPIIDRGDHRNAYFPSGVWYDMRGEEAWNQPTYGDFRSITGYVSETPMFIRGGYTVPTLQSPEGNSIEETLSGNYTLLVALSSSADALRTSEGTLIIKELNTQDNLHQVEFLTEVNQPYNIIRMRINSTCGTPAGGNLTISTIIQSVRVFGLSYLGKLDVEVKNSEEVYKATFTYNGEHFSLRLLNLGMDWCKHSEFHLTVTPEGSGEDSTTTEENEETNTTGPQDDTTVTTAVLLNEP